MSQKRIHSAAETAASTAIGFCVSWAATPFILAAFGYTAGAATAFGITVVYTALSLPRGYVVRRAFNRLQRMQPAAAPERKPEPEPAAEPATLPVFGDGWLCRYQDGKCATCGKAMIVKSAFAGSSDGNPKFYTIFPCDELVEQVEETQPAPAADPERRKAPWPDFAGNPIFEGDWIRHPDGHRARVRFEPRSTGSPGFAEWRCDYECGDELPLGLQIGDKGQAVVEKPAAAAEEAERAAHLERWKNAPEWAMELWQPYPDNGGPAPCYWLAEGLVPEYAGENLLGSVRREPRPTPKCGQGVEG